MVSLPNGPRSKSPLNRTSSIVVSESHFNDFLYFYVIIHVDSRRVYGLFSRRFLCSSSLLRRSQMCTVTKGTYSRQASNHHSCSLFIVIFRVQRLAEDICHDITSPLVALCVLKGGYQFFTDLLDYIKNRNATSGKTVNEFFIYYYIIIILLYRTIISNASRLH